MFFLRCCFWLSIVYASMSWAPGSFGVEKGTAPVQGARALAGEVTQSLASGATDLCLHHAAECMADAARLRVLFAAAADEAASPMGVDNGASATDMIGQDAPRPIPDPRRHARYAKAAIGR